MLKAIYKRDKGKVLHAMSGDAHKLADAQLKALKGFDTRIPRPLGELGIIIK